MNYTIKENDDNILEFNLLYDNVGWGSFDKKIVEESLKNNVYSVSIYDKENIIGYGRIIGDGLIFLYIHDVMVLKEYQSKHIGTLIMNKLLSYIDEIRKINPSVRVYLGASKNKEGFYRKFGFVSRDEYGLGEGMILKNKEND